jgi:hypothetical protein
MATRPTQPLNWLSGKVRTLEGRVGELEGTVSTMTRTFLKLEAMVRALGESNEVVPPGDNHKEAEDEDTSEKLCTTPDTLVTLFPQGVDNATEAHEVEVDEHDGKTDDAEPKEPRQYSKGEARASTQYFAYADLEGDADSFELVEDTEEEDDDGEKGAMAEASWTGVRITPFSEREDPMKCEGALGGGKDRPIQRVLKAHASNETATTAMSHISECDNEDECQSIASTVACDMEAHTAQGNDDSDEDDADKEQGRLKLLADADHTLADLDRQLEQIGKRYGWHCQPDGTGGSSRDGGPSKNKSAK